MSAGSGREDRAVTDDRLQFDGATARRILQRAAEEHRRLSGSANCFSLQELEEIAAEAHISPEALRSAIDAVRQDPDAVDRSVIDDVPHRRGPLAMTARWLRGRSPRVRRMIVAGACSAVLVAVMVAFPAVAEAFYIAMLLALLIFAVLLLIGASP